LIANRHKRTKIYNKSVTSLSSDWWFETIKKPAKLIITSPPYPNVHVLYHRWQIHSRKETSAPYWIANKLDGNSTAHYTMGARTNKGETDYFNNISVAFSKIHKVLENKGKVIQLVGFSNSQRQLPKYLSMMENAGFKRLDLSNSNKIAPYIVRNVPSRKWYAQLQGENSSSREYFLIHEKE